MLDQVDKTAIRDVMRDMEEGMDPHDAVVKVCSLHVREGE